MSSRRSTIALVSREVWPFFEGGGIGRYVRAGANLVAAVADVTIVLPDFYRGAVPDDHPGIPRDVRFAFVPRPRALDGTVRPAPDANGQMRLLHLGRYERRKGVPELVEAVRDLEWDDLTDARGRGHADQPRLDA